MSIPFTSGVATSVITVFCGFANSVSMLRLLKRYFWMGCLALGIQSSWGFALLGPNNEAYQIPDIGYNPIQYFYADLLNSAPKNLGEEYRRNTPVLYYSFDANFLDYFG